MRCSEASLERAEPLAGSGPTARRWLMLEIPKGWESKPLDTPPIDAAAREALAHAEERLDAMVMLVRRAGRQREVTVHRWWAVDTTARTEVSGEWTGPDDLVDAAHALGEPLDTSTEPSRTSLLVCTHATRDQCCAIAGRPLVREIGVRWPEQTWECTHLGGHRFAPTFAVLPDGATYGRVPPGLGVRVIEDHLDNRVHGDLLRGVAGLAPPEQAAVAHALARLAREGRPAGLGDVTVKGTEQVAAPEDTGGERAWRTSVDTPAGCLTLVVTATSQAPTPLSCGPAAPKPSTSYAVHDAAAT